MNFLSIFIDPFNNKEACCCSLWWNHYGCGCNIFGCNCDYAGDDFCYYSKIDDPLNPHFPYQSGFCDIPICRSPERCSAVVLKQEVNYSKQYVILLKFIFLNIQVMITATILNWN